ncbi:hypothetical protein [Marinoscillum furvescens]|uniref:Uncharacterized protein n=1 Tax=Marinoscillum furvescens DSM 4134 TaxID=1122208 RepID=A0A3D9L534_MARFU|nr:hypothetical protein [Marinoscillum furvescens]REE01102.1 hypothetical protein C7460_104122 [Marinoscillum furvescens DSM 4134]
MTDYNATYLGRVANAISQLGNALSGGNPDISVSARIGFMSLIMRSDSLFWIVCRVIVDFTFYPVDGKGHCKNAYLSDIDEDFKVGQGWVPGLVIMSILMILFCLVLSPITWFYYLIRILHA